MKHNDLKDFSPQKIAKIETQMWQAYYRHNFLKLFVLLLRSIHEQFHLNYFYTLKVSYYSATAAIIFRKTRGKEKKEILLNKLINFFKNISKVVINKFDYRKTAELELEWWFVDRYPEKYKISRRDAIKKATASLYNINPEKLEKYADYRAQAMELQDEAEKEKKEANWIDVESLLLVSYISLYKSIN